MCVGTLLCTGLKCRQQFNPLDCSLSEQSDSGFTNGQVFKGGTGAFSLLLDTEKIVNSEYNSDELSGRSEFKNIEPDMFMEDILKYGLNETKFFIPT